MIPKYIRFSHDIITKLLLVGCFLPKPFLFPLLIINVITLLSWLLTRRCIFWDLYLYIDPSYNIKNRLIRLKKDNLIASVIHLLSFNVIGLRLGLQKPVFLFTLIYVILNGGVENPVMDNPEKYISKK